VRQANEYRARSGATPELAQAVSWLARGALAAGDLATADLHAAEARKLALALLRTRKMEADRNLELALGASIEVQAKVMDGREDRAGAVEFLRRELNTYRNSPIHERIRKNLNLLALEGKPAPPLDIARWLGPKPPDAAALRGKPVLLFFWAHWCPDCKGMAPAIAAVRRAYAPQGLVVIGPTKHYGYAEGGRDVTPEEETRYIDAVRKEHYAALADMPAPLSTRNFQDYGASTTPTLVLVDRSGTVRLYHPGAMSETELRKRLDAVLKSATATRSKRK
jgi:thiol-disulfide isomerase/thioredoxin